MRFDPCIVSVISVVVLLVKFVGGYSLMFVCSVNKSFVGRYYYYNYNSTTKMLLYLQWTVKMTKYKRKRSGDSAAFTGVNFSVSRSMFINRCREVAKKASDK